jgi:hypothetical protein
LKPNSNSGHDNKRRSIEKSDLTNPEVDDLLDDLGELVTKMGGKVMIIPHEKMPTKTGVASVSLLSK